MGARRDELLEATLDYLLRNGVGDLSLRPLAAAVGTKARLLIYHFGSREALIAAALDLLLERMQSAFLSMEGDVLAFWKWATDRKTAPYLRLVFEVHGLAPRHPRLYGPYVRKAFQSWRALLGRAGGKGEAATLLIAVVDGLLMDYLATGDRARTTRALRLFMKNRARLR